MKQYRCIIIYQDVNCSWILIISRVHITAMHNNVDDSGTYYNNDCYYAEKEPFHNFLSLKNFYFIVLFEVIVCLLEYMPGAGVCNTITLRI